MSAAVQQPTTRPKVDRDGHHWEQHGASVAIARPGVLEAVTACTLAAHSVRHPRILNGQAHVLLEAGKDPFTLASRMTPLEARTLAAHLVRAADRVDAVVAELGTRRAGL